MSSEVIFLSEVSQFQEVMVRRNKNLLDEVKRHRTSPEKQFKEFNEKLRSTLPDQQIN